MFMFVVDMPFLSDKWSVMSNYHHVYVEQRGSVVIPSLIRKSLGLVSGSCCILREYNGAIFLLPVDREEAGMSVEEIHASVCKRLDRPLEAAPPPVLSPSKTATAEALKLQAARERHAFQMELINAKLRLVEAQAAAREGRSAPKQPYERPNLTADPLDAMLAAREAASTKQLDASLQAASEEMAGTTPTLPQA